MGPDCVCGEPAPPACIGEGDCSLSINRPAWALNEPRKLMVFGSENLLERISGETKRLRIACSGGTRIGSHSKQPDLEVIFPTVGIAKVKKNKKTFVWIHCMRGQM